MMPATLPESCYLPERASSELDFSAPIARGATGITARRVQEWLCFHGFGVDIDAAFGPATQQAVSHFQAGAGLPGTGIVDRATWDALVAPMIAVLRPIPADGQGLAALVLAYGAQHVAQHPLEEGGDNRGPWVRLYLGWDGEAAKWCAGFASFCVEQAAWSLHAPLPMTMSASCTALAGNARSKGLFVGGDDPDLAHKVQSGGLFLVRSGPDTWEHVGIVTRWSDGTIGTFEGNTDHNGSSNGYEAAARTRAITGKDFIRWPD